MIEPYYLNFNFIFITPKLSLENRHPTPTPDSTATTKTGLTAKMEAAGAPEEGEQRDGIEYRSYSDESVLPAIMELVGRDLSEPYSVFTYRYFIHGWPKLCQLVCIVAGPWDRVGTASPQSGSDFLLNR